MLDFDVSKWPPVYQIFAAFGAAIAGAVVWLAGFRGKGDPQTTDRVQAELDTANLRIDLERVMRATREAIHTRIDDVRDELKGDAHELEIRMREAERAIAVLMDRRH